MKIKATATIDGKCIECEGSITLHSVNDGKAYVTWQFEDLKKNKIAGLSKYYFVGNLEKPREAVLNLVVENILKYRIGRRKVFSDIKVESY